MGWCIDEPTRGLFFCNSAHVNRRFLFDFMLPLKVTNPNRMQLDLRKAVQSKVDEGYDVVCRDPDIILTRGCRRISINTFHESIVIKNI